MSNQPVTPVNLGKSKHEVALEMCRTIIVEIEDRYMSDLTRKEFLETYAQCLLATNGKKEF